MPKDKDSAHNLLKKMTPQDIKKLFESIKTNLRINNITEYLRSFSFERQNTLTDQIGRLSTPTRPELIHSCTVLGHVSSIARVCFDRTESFFFTGADDGLIKMWTKEGELVFTFIAHRYAIDDLCVSGDNKMLASVDGLGVLYVWGIESKEVCFSLELGQEIDFIEFVDDERNGHEDNTAELNTNLVQTQEKNSSKEEELIEVLPTYKLLTVERRGVIKTINFNTECINEEKENNAIVFDATGEGNINAVCITEGGRYLLCGGNYPFLLMFDTLKLENRLAVFQTDGFSTAFVTASRNNLKFAASTNFESVFVFEFYVSRLSNRRKKNEGSWKRSVIDLKKGGDAEVSADQLCFLNDDRYLVCFCSDNSLRVFFNCHLHSKIDNIGAGMMLSSPIENSFFVANSKLTKFTIDTNGKKGFLRVGMTENLQFRICDATFSGDGSNLILCDEMGNFIIFGYLKSDVPEQQFFDAEFHVFEGNYSVPVNDKIIYALDRSVNSEKEYPIGLVDTSKLDNYSAQLYRNTSRCDISRVEKNNEMKYLEDIAYKQLKNEFLELSAFLKKYYVTDESEKSTTMSLIMSDEDSLIDNSSFEDENSSDESSIDTEEDEEVEEDEAEETQPIINDTIIQESRLDRYNRRNNIDNKTERDSRPVTSNETNEIVINRNSRRRGRNNNRLERYESINDNGFMQVRSINDTSIGRLERYNASQNRNKNVNTEIESNKDIGNIEIKPNLGRNKDKLEERNTKRSNKDVDTKINKNNKKLEKLNAELSSNKGKVVENDEKNNRKNNLGHSKVKRTKRYKNEDGDESQQIEIEHKNTEIDLSRLSRLERYNATYNNTEVSINRQNKKRKTELTTSESNTEIDLSRLSRLERYNATHNNSELSVSRQNKKRKTEVTNDEHRKVDLSRLSRLERYNATRNNADLSINRQNKKRKTEVTNSESSTELTTSESNTEVDLSRLSRLERYNATHNNTDLSINRQNKKRNPELTTSESNTKVDLSRLSRLERYNREYRKDDEKSDPINEKNTFSHKHTSDNKSINNVRASKMYQTSNYNASNENRNIFSGNGRLERYMKNNPDSSNSSLHIISNTSIYDINGSASMEFVDRDVKKWLLTTTDFFPQIFDIVAFNCKKYKNFVKIVKSKYFDVSLENVPKADCELKVENLDFCIEEGIFHILVNGTDIHKGTEHSLVFFDLPDKSDFLNSLTDINVLEAKKEIVFILENNKQNKILYSAVGKNAYPEYYKYVKYPINFNIVLKRVKNDWYKSLEAFKGDLFFIADNAKYLGKGYRATAKSIIREIEKNI